MPFVQFGFPVLLISHSTTDVSIILIVANYSRLARLLLTAGCYLRLPGVGGETAPLLLEWWDRYLLEGRCCLRFIHFGEWIFASGRLGNRLNLLDTVGGFANLMNI